MTACAPVCTSPSFYLPADALQVIGLSGKAGSGKTTFAKYLHRAYGFVPVALADAFKVPAVVRHGAPIHEVFGSEKSEATRHALQQEGTELGRHVYGEDIWTRTLEAQLYGMAQAGVQRVVVCDIRFPSELGWIHSLGGKVYRLIGRGGTQGQAHSSETALDGPQAFDTVFDNSIGEELNAFNQLRAQVESDFGALCAV